MISDRSTDTVMAEPLQANLSKDNSVEFDFIDGEVSCGPGPGVAGFYEGPYYSFYNWPRSLESEELEDEASLQQAYDLLYDIIEEDGPFDGILGFSHGATLAYGFLAQHRKKNPYDSPNSLFRCAAFFSGMPPFRLGGNDEWVYDKGIQGGVGIPTLHVAGKTDFVEQHTKKLYAMCEPGSARLVVHGKGHEIPGDAKSVGIIAPAFRDLCHRALFS